MYMIEKPEEQKSFEGIVENLHNFSEETYTSAQREMKRSFEKLVGQLVIAGFAYGVNALIKKYKKK